MENQETEATDKRVKKEIKSIRIKRLKHVYVSVYVEYEGPVTFQI